MFEIILSNRLLAAKAGSQTSKLTKTTLAGFCYLTWDIVMLSSEWEYQKTKKLLKIIENIRPIEVIELDLMMIKSTEFISFSLL
jgi:hypothetical protein